MIIRFNVRLRCTTDLLPGSGEIGDRATMLATRSAAGDLVVSPTAIVGAMHTHAEKLSPLLGIPVEALFGSDGGSRIESAWESPLAISACAFVQPVRPQVVDGVAIARASGSADRATGAKFEYELLPADAEVAITFELDTAPLTAPAVAKLGITEDDARLLLAALLVEWQRPDAISLGRGFASGQGRTVLTACDAQELFPAAMTDDQILASLELGYHNVTGAPMEVADAALVARVRQRLAERGASVPVTWDTPVGLGDGVRTQGGGQAATRAHATLTHWLRIDLHLACAEQFLSADVVASARAGFEAATAWRLVNGEPRAILRGPAARGSLRSRAEYLARSRWEWATVDAPDVAACPACHPTSNGALARCSLALDQSGIASSADDAEYLCRACRLFGSTRLGSRLAVIATLAEAASDWKPQEHVAIDRFTGGARDQLKFDALYTWGPVFPVSLYMETPGLWEIGWLVDLLQDIQTNGVTLGARSSTGVGWFALRDGFSLTAGWAATQPPWAATFAGGGTVGLYQTATWTQVAAAPWPSALLDARDRTRALHASARRRMPAGAILPRDAVDAVQRDLYFSQLVTGA